MKVVGLVTEYNPFHKGHLYHLEEAKKLSGADYCVAVMSGNFVQRGDPAIVDKWTRTRIALENGVDLVIELPVHYSTSSAEFFSSASIALLEGTGIVDSICFGSEVGELKNLDQIAGLLWNETDGYKVLLSGYLDQGFNFPKARSLALKEYFPHMLDDVINSPNNILGIEYLKALKRLGSNMEPYTLLRMGASYHDQGIGSNMVSATGIRNMMKTNPSLFEDLENSLPPFSYLEIRKAMETGIAPILSNDFFPLLKYKLLTTSAKDLMNILDVNEGLENRILSTIMQASSWGEFLDLLLTKRYTKTKINRALCHILLGIDKKAFQVFNNNGFSQYIKVLGFRKESQFLMREMKEKSTLPLVINVKKSEKHFTSLQKKMLQDEIRSTNIYNTVVLSKFGNQVKNDYTQSIVIL